MIELLQVAAGLGVGAFLGTLIFIMYRVDRKASEERHLKAWKASEERLSSIIERDQESRQENTKALTEITTLLIRLNGRLK